jgi:hypothetical protein
MAFSELLKTFDINDGDLKYLQSQIDTAWTNENAEKYIPEIVKFMDRLGDSDLYGIAWSLLHGLESLPKYESAVVNDWKPTTWRKRLVRRMINAKMTDIDGVKLENLLA